MARRAVFALQAPRRALGRLCRAPRGGCARRAGDEGGASAALANLGAEDVEARAWQKGLDKAFLDPDASPMERLWGLRDILQDLGGVPGALVHAGSAIASKGFQAGRADALNALFPQGTLARSDLEGLAAIARQAPEVIEDLQVAASAQAVAGFVPEAKPPDLNRIRDRLSRLMSFQGISDALIRSVESAFDGLRVTPRAIQEPRYQVAARDEGFEVRLYNKFTAAVRRKPLANASSRSRAIDPFNALVSQVFDFDESPLAANATMPMEIRYNASVPTEWTAFFVAPPNVKPETKLFVSNLGEEEGMEEPAAPVRRKPPPGCLADVAFVEVPERALAVRRFPGIATAAEVKRQYAVLIASLAVTGIYEPAQVGVFSVMQYNPPHTVPFRRRNDIAMEVHYNAANAAKANARAAAMAAAAAAASHGGNDTEASEWRAELARQRNAYGSMIAELWQYLNDLRNSTVHVGDYMQLKELVERQSSLHGSDVSNIRRSIEAASSDRAGDAAQFAKAVARFDSMFAEQEQRSESLADRVEALRGSFVDRSKHDELMQDFATHKTAHSASIAGLWTSLEGVRNTINAEASRKDALEERIAAIEGQRDAYSEAMQVLMAGVEELRARADESTNRDGTMAEEALQFRRASDEERQKMWHAIDALRGKVVEEATEKQAMEARFESHRAGQDAAIEALRKSMEVVRADVEAQAIHEDLSRSMASQQEGLSSLSNVVEELRARIVDMAAKDESILAEVSAQKDATQGVSEMWSSLDALRDALDEDRAKVEAAAKELEAQKAAHDDGIERLTRSMAELKENLAKELEPERFIAQLEDHKAATSNGVADLWSGLESLRESVSTDRSQFEELAAKLEAQRAAQSDGLEALEKQTASMTAAMKASIMSELNVDAVLAELNAQKAAYEEGKSELIESTKDLRSAIQANTEEISTELELQKMSSKTTLDEVQANMEALQRNISEAFDAQMAQEAGREDERAAREQTISEIWRSLDELRASVAEAGAQTGGVSQEVLTATLAEQSEQQAQRMEAIAATVDELRKNLLEASQLKDVMEELESQKALHTKHINHLMKAVDDLRSRSGGMGFGIKA